MNTTQQWGNDAEKMVADYLTGHGFSILVRNYRKQYGEIDIIAQTKTIMAFIEVKMRHDDKIPLESLITRPKQKRMLMVAQEYMSKNYIQCAQRDCRFDVALIHHTIQGPKLTYIPNAFMEHEVGSYDHSF
jgi:putative endonuclease